MVLIKIGNRKPIFQEFFIQNFHLGSINFVQGPKHKINNGQKKKILILTINPPFWFSGIFIFGSFVFLTFLFIFYSKVRLNIVKRQRNNLKIIADQRLTKLMEVNKDLQKQKMILNQKIEGLKNSMKRLAKQTPKNELLHQY